MQTVVITFPFLFLFFFEKQTLVLSKEKTQNVICGKNICGVCLSRKCVMEGIPKLCYVLHVWELVLRLIIYILQYMHNVYKLCYVFESTIYGDLVRYINIIFFDYIWTLCYAFCLKYMIKCMSCVETMYVISHCLVNVLHYVVIFTLILQLYRK